MPDQPHPVTEGANTTRTQNGFTLLELAVVMAIMGILAGFAVYNFMGAIRNGFIGQAYLIRSQLDSGLAMYVMHTKLSTTNFADYVTDGVIPSGSNYTVSLLGNQPCTQDAIGNEIICYYNQYGVNFDVTFGFDGNGEITDDIPAL